MIAVMYVKCVFIIKINCSLFERICDSLPVTNKSNRKVERENKYNYNDIFLSTTKERIISKWNHDFNLHPKIDSTVRSSIIVLVLAKYIFSKFKYMQI